MGRYVVLARLGAGAMGVVYAAYDPELDRKVAIKLVLSKTSIRGGDPRLLREAQALARLAHPNVVAVHDVGTHEDQIFVAMEFVEGRTLSGWLEETKPPWPRVVDVMLDAGRGLAAAHARELVHRDFKPDNVMLGNDGRVRVMDFGLARTDMTSTGDEESVALTVATPRRDALGLQLTRRGAMIGTPAYMAPEQLEGRESGPLADQFSFCVSLWEALYGERPFRGESFVELAAKIFDGSVSEPVARSNAPRWLRRIVERGLRVDPLERWPRMVELLDALRSGKQRVRRRRVWIAMSAFSIVGLSIAGAHELIVHGKEKACEHAGAAIATVWNPTTAAEVKQRFVASGIGYALAAADKVIPLLDAHAEAWRMHRTEACLATSLRGEWDAVLFDRSLWCLDERRMELEELVATLLRADGQVIQKAVWAASALASADPCVNRTVIANLPDPPGADAVPETVAIRRELAKALTLRATGQYSEGTRIAVAARARAEALEWPPLLAQALRVEGSLHYKAGSFEASVSPSIQAYIIGAKAGAWRDAALAAEGLIHVIGFELERPADADTWTGLAEVAALHAGDQPDLRESERAQNLANVRFTEARYDESAELFRRALVLRKRIMGENHPRVAATLSSLANVHYIRDEFQEAIDLDTQAMKIDEQTLGPDHPELAADLDNLGGEYHAIGSDRKAKELFERALRIRERALGPDHPDVTTTLNNLGIAYESLGQYPQARLLFLRSIVVLERQFGEDSLRLYSPLTNLGNTLHQIGEDRLALSLFQRSLELAEAHLSPDHPRVAKGLHNVAAVHASMGTLGLAKAYYERSLTIDERAFGVGSLATASTLNNLGMVHRELGDRGKAKALFERALGIREQSLGARHPDVAATLNDLASIVDSREAVELLERSVAIYDWQPGVSDDELRSRFGLARALVKAGVDRARAMTEARLALDGYRNAGPGRAAAVAEIERFVDEHGGH